MPHLRKTKQNKNYDLFTKYSTTTYVAFLTVPLSFDIFLFSLPRGPDATLYLQLLNMFDLDMFSLQNQSINESINIFVYMC